MKKNNVKYSNKQPPRNKNGKQTFLFVVVTFSQSLISPFSAILDGKVYVSIYF